jgi:hypothetical protein
MNSKQILQIEKCVGLFKCSIVVSNNAITENDRKCQNVEQWKKEGKRGGNYCYQTAEQISGRDDQKIAGKCRQLQKKNIRNWCVLCIVIMTAVRTACWHATRYEANMPDIGFFYRPGQKVHSQAKKVTNIR